MAWPASAFHSHPEPGNRIQQVELTLELHTRLRGEAPIVFDMFPRTGTEERTGDISLALGPGLQFGPVAASVGQVGTTINLKWALPVVTAGGVDESTAHWLFEERATHPLRGSQSVYLVVALAQPQAGLTARLEFKAEVLTNFGPVHAVVPDSERYRLDFVLL